MGGEVQNSLGLAQRVARGIVDFLRPYCDRIEIAGSIRRRDACEVGDIEIVLIPKMIPTLGTLFGGTSDKDLNDFTEEGIKNAVEIGLLAPHPKDPKDGKKYKKMWHPKDLGIQVDIFIVRPPAQWGTILAVRTGPADFNKKIVTECQAKGLRVKDGHVEKYIDGKWHVVDTPEECDFFFALGLPHLKPEDRLADKV